MSSKLSTAAKKLAKEYRAARLEYEKAAVNFRNGQVKKEDYLAAWQTEARAMRVLCDLLLEEEDKEGGA